MNNDSDVKQVGGREGIDTADIWKRAYVAVYGCEPSHGKEAYQAAYDVIADAILSAQAPDLARLREALEPVMVEIERLEKEYQLSARPDYQYQPLMITAGDIKLIRAALGKGGEK